MLQQDVLAGVCLHPAAPVDLFRSPLVDYRGAAPSVQGSLVALSLHGVGSPLCLCNFGAEALFEGREDKTWTGPSGPGRGHRRHSEGPEDATFDGGVTGVLTISPDMFEDQLLEAAWFLKVCCGEPREEPELMAAERLRRWTDVILLHFTRCHQRGRLWSGGSSPQ